ncbi:hypothetical protein FAIPA1_10386 [Frankia sp. AiPs1]
MTPTSRPSTTWWAAEWWKPRPPWPGCCVLAVLCFGVAAFVLRWDLALLAFAAGPLYWLLTRRLSHRVQAATEEQRLAEGHIAAVVEENITASALIQTHVMAAHERRRPDVLRRLSRIPLRPGPGTRRAGRDDRCRRGLRHAHRRAARPPGRGPGRAGRWRVAPGVRAHPFRAPTAVRWPTATRRDHPGAAA